MAIPRAVLRIFKGKGTKNAWRWSFAVNGRIMADSAEGYAQKQTARRAWRKLYTRVIGKQFAVKEDGTPEPVNPRLATAVKKAVKKTAKKTARKAAKKAAKRTKKVARKGGKKK